jgi:polyhydroxyalkanoate synthesis repressor PhaR
MHFKPTLTLLDTGQSLIGTGGAMSDPRVIKKYPNRRLYDTVESRYITLGDVRKLVVDRIDFVVIDKKSQNDITRSILLQVIADQEHTEPVMSRDFLSHIIRSYGGPLHSMIGSYLEQSVKLFVAQQRELRERGKALSSNDAEAVTGLASRNYQRWRSVQDEIYSTLVRAAGRGAEEDELAAARARQ